MDGDALVLGGGGVAGIAWETGVLLGLQDAAPDLVHELLAPSTTLIGTSAGSTVAAQVALGSPLAELFAAQTADATAEVLVELDLPALLERMGAAVGGAATPEERRRGLGAMALAADTPAPAIRMAAIHGRIPTPVWPERPLVITAVDAGTGVPRTFERSDGVSLVDAVAASCAVPGVWPTVEIQGRRYMDGGMRTVANADLAVGAERVLILVPMAQIGPFGPGVPDDELTALAASRVRVVFADEASLEAMGQNALDPATRRPTAEAGRVLGQRLAAEIAAFWGPSDPS